MEIIYFIVKRFVKWALCCAMQYNIMEIFNIEKFEFTSKSEYKLEFIICGRTFYLENNHTPCLFIRIFVCNLD